MSRNKTINVDNIIESKRTRKPKEVFVPEDPRERKRWQSFKNLTVPRRNRNEAISGDHVNRWNNYRTVIKRLLACLLKETHYRELYSQSVTVKSDDKELRKIDSKILGWKQAILSTFEAIEAENPDHKRWPALGEPDEEDMVEVADILCSRCNGEETPGNDILFCDRASCLRAYHQLCLDPPLAMANFDADQDWFCWQCECLDDCLDLLSERLNEEYSRWQDLFPEVREAASVRDTLAGAVLAEDEEEAVDADDEYAPTAEEMRAEEEELEDASQSGSLDEGNGEEGGEDENEDEEDARENELYKKLRALNDQQQISLATDDDDQHMVEDNDEDDDAEEIGDDELVSDLESDLDEDEVAGLLQDAAEDLDYLPLGPQMTSSTTAEPVARRLRDRSRLQRSQQTLLYGARDVSREIARVVRGVFVLGTISQYTDAPDTSLDDPMKLQTQHHDGIGLQELDPVDHQTKNDVAPDASTDNGSSTHLPNEPLLTTNDHNDSDSANHHEDRLSTQEHQPTQNTDADVAQIPLRDPATEPNTSTAEEPAAGAAVDLSTCTAVESGCWILTYEDGYVLETRDPSQVRYQSSTIALTVYCRDCVHDLLYSTKPVVPPAF